MPTAVLPERRTYGYARKRELPARPGTARVCRKCSAWFLAAPREAVCWPCLPNWQRAKRAAKPATLGHDVELVTSQVNAAEIGALTAIRDRAIAEGRQLHIPAPESAPRGDYSEVLGLHFRPGAPLHRQLAIEAAAEDRRRHGAPRGVPETLSEVGHAA